MTGGAQITPCFEYKVLGFGELRSFGLCLRIVCGVVWGAWAAWGYMVSVRACFRLARTTPAYHAITATGLQQQVLPGMIPEMP